MYDAKNGQLVHDKFLWTNPVVVNEAIITSDGSETKHSYYIFEKPKVLVMLFSFYKTKFMF